MLLYAARLKPGPFKAAFQRAIFKGAFQRAIFKEAFQRNPFKEAFRRAISKERFKAAFQRTILESHLKEPSQRAIYMKAAEAFEIFRGQRRVPRVTGLSKVTGMDDRNSRDVISIGSTDDLKRVPKAISGSATFSLRS